MTSNKGGKYDFKTFKMYDSVIFKGANFNPINCTA